MTRRFKLKNSVLMMSLLVGSMLGTAAISQGPPHDGGGRGGFGRGPMGGPGRGTAVHAPVSALAAGLKLSDDQKSQITSIQDALRQQRDTLLPRPGQGGDGPPDPETMRAAFDKLRAAESQADKDIAAVLTDSQKQALPGLLKRFDALRMGGIPLELYGDLKLTADQQTKIAAIAKSAQSAMPEGGPGGPRDGGPGGPPEGGPGGPPDGGPGGPPEGGPGGRGGGRGPMGAAGRKVHQQVMAVLTDSQKAKVKEWIAAHPRNQGRPGPGGPEAGPDGGPGRPGGPGGPGGPGDGPPPAGGNEQ